MQARVGAGSGKRKFVPFFNRKRAASSDTHRKVGGKRNAGSAEQREGRDPGLRGEEMDRGDVGDESLRHDPG